MTEKKPISISCSKEIVEAANKQIIAATKATFAVLNSMVGEDLPIPMFLHINLCRALDAVWQYAPSMKEAKRFILAAVKEVEEQND